MPTPTMSQIAEACGVSTMTVSYVLNRKPGVSDATRERVTKVMEEMGYESNPHAARLSRAKGNRKSLSKGIGCILGEAANKYSDPYYGDIVQRIEKELIDRGFHMVFLHAWHDLEADALLRASLLSKNIIDGAFCIGLPSESIEEIQKHTEVLVGIDSICPSGLDNITSDHFDGGYVATEHLLKLGHRKIAYIGHKFAETSKDRVDGYYVALQKHGVEKDNDLLLQSDLSVEGGLNAINTLLESGHEFTAVFCHNDAIACGVIKGLRRANLSVPEDVSIVGYNNDFIAELVEPEITTIAVDKASLGQLAVSEIVERIEGRNIPARKQTLPIHLVERQTTAAPKSR